MALSRVRRSFAGSARGVFLAVTAGLAVVACGGVPEEPPPQDAPPEAPRVVPVSGGACGSSGTRCSLGAPCRSAADCESLLCRGGVCRASACDDGQQGGDETGVDCGGACPTRCDGEPCTRGVDCQSALCGAAGTCLPRGAKTCGVGTPRTCAEDETCANDRDCGTDYCRAFVCKTPPASAHDDGRRNAGETGVDCGGSAAPERPCGSGQKCLSSDDCLSTCTTGRCDAPGPGDGKRNADETDVDCGGATAPGCEVGLRCTSGADCGLGLCDAGLCGVPTATDGKKNGAETDVDCGGETLSFGAVVVPAAPRCELGAGCAVDADCASAVCANDKRCVEAPSCRDLHGGRTCGLGELGDPLASHESCCKTLPVPGLTLEHGGVVKQVYVDKYEITAGRVRAWVDGIRGAYGGVPNVKAWIMARAAVDPLVATQIKATNYPYLPDRDNGQIVYVPPGNTDMGLESQLGPTSYVRGWSTTGTSGCSHVAGGYGHRTYYTDAAFAASFNEVPRDPTMKDVLDEKSMNCTTPIMFAAFCAWDGGYLVSQEAIAAAYGPHRWPWGAAPATVDERIAELHFYTNFNNGTSGFGATKAPTYLFPVRDYATFANDLSPVIAAPGRFATDKSLVRPFAGSDESWMDLGGNMLEWSTTAGEYFGWTGSSFEGHYQSRNWTNPVVHIDKYGKAGARCMRLR